MSFKQVACLLPGRKSLAILAVSLFFSSAAFGQNITVSGQVTEEGTGDPLIGVNIIQEGTTLGTVTDIDGNYQIVIPADAVLDISYIGYKKQTIPVEGRTMINIEMEVTAVGLEEVVVVGYGTTRKRDLTGSVNSIKEEDIRAIPVVSADQALQGRAAGVFVQQNSGEPGAGTTIRIRGTSSISAGNEPLYVIDGIPIITQTEDFTTEAAQGPRLNPLSTINPNDIVSIEILKDASAAAIYGARAANGVVLITTKRGQAGRSEVSFNYYQGWQEVANPYELLDASQFARFINEASFNAGDGRVYDDPERFGEGTDWQEELFRVAPMANYELSFSGGNEKVQYAVSGAYYNQEGVIIGSDFDRYNFRANIDAQLSKRVKISNSLMTSYTNSSRIRTDDDASFDGGAITATLGFNPMLPVRDEEGNFVQKNYAVDNNGEIIDGTQVDSNGNPISEELLNTFANPILAIEESSSFTKIARIIDNLTTTISIIEGLDFKVSLGVDFSTSRDDNFTPAESRPGGESFALSGSTSTLSLLNENTLNFKRDYGRHRIDAVGGFTVQKTQISSSLITAINFPTDAFGFDNYQAASGVDINTNFPEFAFLSGLARVNYGYDNRFLFTFTGRSDGSSKFGENNKWGFFPSASVAWAISEEEFMKPFSALSFMKLRMSYGVIGNEAIGPFLSQALLVPVNLSFNDILTIGFEPFLFPNSDLRWESTRQFNAGIDASLFDSRLSITADYYIKNTFDLLLTTDVPFYTGFPSVFGNVGDLENRGFEFSFNSYNLIGDFKWSTDFNIAFNNNTVTSLAGRDSIPNSGANLFGVESWALLVEGEEVGTFFGLLTDGIFQIGDDPDATPRFAGEPPLQPGDRKFKDLNGDGVISDEDRTFIGQAQPDFIFGFNNTFSYKGFDLSVFFQGVYGNEIVNFNKFLIENGNGTSNITLDYYANRWTPENPTDEYPRVNADPGLSRRFISDAEVEDGSYIRLRSLSLGYNFQPRVLEELRLSRLRIYVTARNLLTFTNYSGYDPEVGHFGQQATNLGADLGGFPNTRSYLFGVDIGF